ncbi:NAD(P)H-dependent glycerol-3-phosphate dehydrogenase [Nannocystis radixulma]|uniref:Glycerol-3-phosphate dehydrogenase [NAD(P)+] n=1 Tax=Nannocystis radixulma TaxID=2995305 RepID=A0ABT5B0G8_9BACT|nr:NAD(P)H-dependent glycerol-3-phosphate dehydrogenase [Nannocystis radixulma]MDC0667233.1 NAD(P)-dependent glycerol-3-phosphate dehydrogenase [Nannocystis radixulma]
MTNDPASPPPPTVAVLGAGSWGTALALHCARRGLVTRLWTRSHEHFEAMAAAGVNARYLPEFPFPDNLSVEHDLGRALAGAGFVILAIPSHGLRATLHLVDAALARLGAAAPLPYYLVAAKGVEIDSLRTMADVVHETLPKGHAARMAVLGGPSFAAEVARGLPTAVVIASADQAAAAAIQQWMHGDGLRVYVTHDVVGVELGGAFKNVIALAAGVCDGAGLGQNARAALITRGLAEIGRLCIALGADPVTLSGLAGLGDLVLTCTGGLSRNRRVGLALGQGRALQEILDEMGMVAEGVNNTLSAHRLAQRERVEMPITQIMHAILYEGMSVRRAVAALMQRDVKPERD